VESRGRVMVARSTVPLALASALDEANLGSRRPLTPVHSHRLRWRMGH
jgi:uncharacterized protein YqfA (UPF0365 family)